MIEFYKRRIKGCVIIKKEGEHRIPVIREKIINLLEEEKEETNKTEEKKEFEFIMQTLAGTLAYVLEADKVEIYFDDDNYFRKQPEVEITNKRLAYVLTQAITLSKTKGAW